MSESKKEDKFYIFLKKDCDNYLVGQTISELERIQAEIERCRKQDGKPVRSYIACGQHEPYAEKVWQTILDGEDEKVK